MMPRERSCGLSERMAFKRAAYFERVGLVGVFQLKPDALAQFRRGLPAGSAADAAPIGDRRG